jgi:hypothetical protein
MSCLSLIVKLVIPLGMFMWSLFHPTLASWIFVGLTALFVGWLFLAEIMSNPSPDPLIWRPDECEIIRKYYLAIRYPHGANTMSNFLNGIRMASLIWIPWMLWNHLWIPALFLAINYYLSAPLACRLDPFFTLSLVAQKGHVQFAEELIALRAVSAKLDDRMKEEIESEGMVASSGAQEDTETK